MMPNTPSLSVSFDHVVEPLTPASERAFENGATANLRESGFIPCHAYTTIKRLLLEYCEGRVLGHSLLISGHRGSGKTQLTHLAIECVQQSLKEGLDRIPFVVSLHGTDLLCPPGKPDSYLVEHAVQQIVFGLHRSFADAIIKRFASSAGKRNAELSAHLTMQLNHHPGLAELRAAWAAAGLLSNGGVLQTGDPAQGPKEIIALQTLDQAVQSEPRDMGISFDVPLQSQAAGKDERVAFRIRHVHQFVRVLAPVMGVIAGFLAVYSSLGKVSDPIARGLVFFSTTFIVNRFLQEFSSAGLDGALSENKTLPDLDRLLPMLVSRVNDAGFAPIFVVDELDKIPDLAARLKSFMRHLKYFVTDRAFFCFLTDRSYFEEFDAHLRREAHPPEETFFGERILVHYNPRDFYTYLQRQLKVEDQTPDQLSEDALFRRLLLFRSRVHPDLLRQAFSSNVGDGQVLITGSLWKVFGYLLAVYMQIAIEAVYEDPSTQLRIRQKPEFGQWVLDTLYYPATTWEDGNATFSISREKLRRHLDRQISLAGDDSRNMCARSALFEDDLQFLWGKLNELVVLLSRPIQPNVNLLFQITTLLGESTSDSAKVALTAVVCLVIPPAISAMEVEHTDVEERDQTFHWRFDRFGNWRALFGESQSYLQEFQSGKLKRIATKRFAPLLAWEQKIRSIWPQFRYNQYHMSSTANVEGTSALPHLEDLPEVELWNLGPKLPHVVHSLETAIKTEAWHLDGAWLRQLKREFLTAVLARSEEPPQGFGQSNGDSAPPPQSPRIQDLIGKFNQIGTKTPWDVLLQIHRELQQEPSDLISI
jgi:hypothetical protein